MGPVRDFAANLARGGADASKILQEIAGAFLLETMSRQNVNSIIRTVKAGHDASNQQGWNTEKRVRTPEAIAAVEAVVRGDRRCTVDQIEEETGLSHPTYSPDLAPADFSNSKSSSLRDICGRPDGQNRMGTGLRYSPRRRLRYRF